MEEVRGSIPLSSTTKPQVRDLGFFRFLIHECHGESSGELRRSRRWATVGQGNIPDRSFEPPAAPIVGQPWPRATSTAYPLKPTDSLLPDGTIRSEALGRVKDNQHEHRVVVQWVEDRWVVVRRRLVPADGGTASADSGGSFGAVFDPTPEQWGLRGDPEVWAAMKEMLEEEFPETIDDDGRELLRRSFRSVTGVEVAEPVDRVYVESIDRGGMSGGWVDLGMWRSTLMPLVEERVRRLMKQR